MRPPLAASSSVEIRVWLKSRNLPTDSVAEYQARPPLGQILREFGLKAALVSMSFTEYET